MTTITPEKTNEVRSIKTSELTGAALDWAVAGLENIKLAPIDDGDMAVYYDDANDELQIYSPSTKLFTGGPIIDRAAIETLKEAGIDNWVAVSETKKETGPTMLIAAMRCYVASKLGDEVNVPVELLAELNDRYADTIISDATAYDGLEIHGVRDFHFKNDDLGTSFEVDDANPQSFAVYVHLKEGGVDCVGDFARLSLAKAYANELAVKYGWPVKDFAKNPQSPPSAKDMEVRVLVGAQYAYACIKTEKTTMDVRLEAGRSASKSLIESAQEMRDRAAQLTKRAALIEAASALI